MIKKLVKHGNSYALVIDKPVLELLQIGPETDMEIVTDGNTLTLVPIRDEKRRKRLETALGKVNKKYGKMLKRLAE